MAAPAAAGAPAPAAGSGFVFEADQLDDVIRRWQDLLDDLRSDQGDAERMAHVRPPGREFASGDFADAANPSGLAFLESNQRMQSYIEDYIRALERARQSITTREAETQAEISRAGEQPE